jgi:uncharacterized protein
MPFTDTPVVFDSPRGALVGMLHLPDGNAAQTGVLLCHAFGEERKSSALTMTRLARAIAAAGRAALQFDYAGCGDSAGDFVDADVQTRLDDIACAAAFLRRETGVDSVCLLGLRLGATLALESAGAMPHCCAAVLLEPITDGAKYLGGEMRRKLVRQMMTDGAGRMNRAEVMKQLEQDDAVFDLDGFAIRGAAYRQLSALGIRPNQVAFTGPTLVCQLHFNDKPKAELQAACEAIPNATMRSLVLPPVWSRIDITLAPDLNATVTEWLAEHGGRH